MKDKPVGPATGEESSARPSLKNPALPNGAAMNKDQYIESLRKLNLKVYLFGELVENPVDHPMIRPSMNSVAMTYELAEQEEHKDLMTATSNLTGKTVNRVTKAAFCRCGQSANKPYCDGTHRKVGFSTE